MNYARRPGSRHMHHRPPGARQGGIFRPSPPNEENMARRYFDDLVALLPYRDRAVVTAYIDRCSHDELTRSAGMAILGGRSSIALARELLEVVKEAAR